MGARDEKKSWTGAEMLYCYQYNMKRRGRRKDAEKGMVRGGIPVERVQLGVRIEKRMMKVLKGLAEYYDVSLGTLLEGIVLHAFEGRDGRSCPSPFSADAYRVVNDLKKVYGMAYSAHDNYRFTERDVPEGG